MAEHSPHEGLPVNKRFIVESFDATDKDAYSYDDVLQTLTAQAMKAASLGYCSMLFNFEYEQTETEESIRRQLDPPELESCCYRIVESSGRHVEILWNKQNSPHLAATLACAAPTFGMEIMFPFIKGQVWNELVWATSEDAQRFVEVSKVAGGYEAYKRGVPIDDIVA